jgi:RNA polymerase sigma-70 factor, ECF subfamily
MSTLLSPMEHATGPSPSFRSATAMRPAGAATSAAPTTELSLLRRMAAGDERALGALYDRWAGPLYASVLRMVGDPGIAEEIVAATFWQAWQQASRYEPSRGAVSTWLVTIGRSRALDLLRARRRSRADLLGSDRELAEIPAPGADPALHAEALERRQRVHLALGDLPAEQRQVLELAYFAGLSQTEIADRTGLPLGTVKTRSRLALQKLRVMLRVLSDGAACA